MTAIVDHVSLRFSIIFLTSQEEFTLRKILLVMDLGIWSQYFQYITLTK